MKRILFLMPLLLLAACEDRYIEPGSEESVVERPADLATPQDIADAEATRATVDAQVNGGSGNDQVSTSQAPSSTSGLVEYHGE